MRKALKAGNTAVDVCKMPQSSTKAINLNQVAYLTVRTHLHSGAGSDTISPLAKLTTKMTKLAAAESWKTVLDSQS